MRLQGMGDWIDDLQAMYSPATPAVWNQPVAAQPVVDTSVAPSAGGGVLDTIARLAAQGMNYSLQSQAISKGTTVPGTVTATRTIATSPVISYGGSMMPFLLVGGVAVAAFMLLRK